MLLDSGTASLLVVPMSLSAPTIPANDDQDPAAVEWARHIADTSAREAALTAFAAMRHHHAEWELRRATVRADEPTRFVIVVFYHLPGVPPKPCPYRLVSVGRHSGQVAELLGREAVPYLL